MSSATMAGGDRCGGLEGHLALSRDGRRLLTRGALSELTSAVAMGYCADKRMTRRVLEAAGLRVPRGRLATFDEADVVVLVEVGELVITLSWSIVS